MSIGIYIKGMEMPTSCMDCPFKGFDRAGGRGNICTINDSITLHAVLDGADVKFVRMGDCPLIAVPPHGRLIDANNLETDTEWSEYEDDFTSYSRSAILNAPTILEAEEGE